MASPIFKTFTADTQLTAGICILRPLANGKYEIANLQTVSGTEISSEASGLVIKNDPERRNALAISPEVWEDVQLKAWQSVRSADSAIFRIFKLPMEVRYIIYDLVLVAKRPIQIRAHPNHTSHPSSLFNPALLQVCRQFRDEGAPFFWRNIFHVTLPTINLAVMHIQLKEATYANMVKTVTYTWFGAFNDKRAFQSLGQFPQLEKLIVRYNYRMLSRDPHRRPQKLHQTHPSTAGFKHTYGFDGLCMMRGLKEVVLEASEFDKSSAEAKKHHVNFQKFLTTLLTKPKPQPTTKASKKRKAAAAKLSPRQLQRQLDQEIRNLA